MNKNRIRGGGGRTSGQVSAKPISIKYVRRKLRWQCAESDRTYLGRSASCPPRVFRPKLDCARRKAYERGAEVSRGHSNRSPLSSSQASRGRGEGPNGMRSGE